RAWVKILAWGSAVIILGLNFWLAARSVGPWLMEAPWRIAVFGPMLVAVIVLLGWVMFAGGRRTRVEAAHTGTAVVANLPEPIYRKILVPLDHSDRDRVAIATAASMARLPGAAL